MSFFDQDIEDPDDSHPCSLCGVLDHDPDWPIHYRKVAGALRWAHTICPKEREVQLKFDIEAAKAHHPSRGGGYLAQRET